MAQETKGKTERRLIIHCGVQKTGSTAFHHFLSRNHATLAPHLEVFTPKAGTVTRHLGKTSGLFSLNEKHKDDLIALVHQMRDKIMMGHGPCLISHENLPGAMIGRAGVTRHYPKIEDVLTLLDIHFAPLQPEYVFYTRDMPAWKSSVYSQAVYTDGYQKTRSAFLDETAKCGSWAELQGRVEAVVGQTRCKFFALEDEIDKDQPGLQLLRFADVPEAALETLKPLKNRPNQSLNAGSLEFLRKLNNEDIPNKARRSVARLVRQNPTLFVPDKAAL